MLNFKRIAIAAVLSGAALFGSYQAGHSVGAAGEREKQQEVLVNEYIKKSVAETEKRNAIQRELDKIGAKHAEEMAELEGSTDGIINGLNADNKRLRVKLKTIPGSAGGSGQCITSADGRAELDESASKRLIGITQQGDKWIKNLQDTVRVLQHKLDEKEATHGN